MAEITSFHGADGCGKSSIAEQLVALREAKGPVVMIGGSSYKQWLSPEVARETLGSSAIVGAVPQSVEEKSRLYEDVAVACYGYAAHLAELGTDVIIDSDPVIKRVMWNRLEQPDVEQRDRYSARFGNYLLDRLPAYARINLVVGVNIDGSATESDIGARLAARGGNSDYDPQTPDEVRTVCYETQQLWEELLAGQRGSSRVGFFNEFYISSNFTAVDNPACSVEAIKVQLRKRAEHIDSLLQ